MIYGRKCRKCGGPIDPHRRITAFYCTSACREGYHDKAIQARRKLRRKENKRVAAK
jgi:reverse gyrase